MIVNKRLLSSMSFADLKAITKYIEKTDSVLLKQYSSNELFGALDELFKEMNKRFNECFEIGAKT